MKQVTNVLEFANAAAIERINYELIKVLENVQNPNTDEKPRKLTVEMCITPVNGRTAINIKTTVKKALRPTNAVHTQMAVAILDGTYQLVFAEIDTLFEKHFKIYRDRGRDVDLEMVAKHSARFSINELWGDIIELKKKYTEGK